MIHVLESVNNPKLKQIAKLVASKQDRYDQKKFVLEGFRSIVSMLEHVGPHYHPEALFISETFSQSDRFRQLHDLSPALDYYQVNDRIFNKLTDVECTQGVLALVSFKLNIFVPVHQGGACLLLDSVSDPGNMGTLIRSALAAGFRNVLLFGNCVDPYNPKTLRASMGIFSDLVICHIIESQLDDLLSAGYDIIVTRMDGDHNIFRTDFIPSSVICVGSEANGISEELLAKATRSVYIPMSQSCESLNAAIAGSLCMFQLSHQLELIAASPRR